MNKITKDNMETNKIVIYINGLEHESKKQWLSVSKSSLFYLSGGFGRLYFFVNNFKESNYINDFKFNDIDKSISFTYNGDWECESDNEFKIIQVNDKYEICFTEPKYYNKIIELLK